MQVIEYVPAFVFIIAVAAIAGWVLRSNWLKGLRGELSVRFVTWLGLKKSVYRRLHDLTLRTPDGTTQIDHVFISRFGVFVVETKHVRGWIFGNAADRRWTQSLYGKKSQFPNPLHQNYKHVKAVEDALGADPGVIHSVVVFTADAKFKTALPPNVTYLGKFVRHIKSFGQEILPQELVDRFVSDLQRRSLPKSHILSRTHVRRLRRRSDPNAFRRCPKCGSHMVIRTARKGGYTGRQFMACSAYPNCQYTQKIKWKSAVN